MREHGFVDFWMSMTDTSKTKEYSPRVQFNVDEILAKDLANSLEFADFAEHEMDGSSAQFGCVPKEVWEKYAHSLGTEFYGLIPKETKEKLQNTSVSFNKVYLISETFPEQWTETRKKITIDPLLIGVNQKLGRCFLIDHFDTTSLENQIALEFTETQIQ